EKSKSSLWAAFEYRYFNAKGWLSGKVDICASANNSRAWFEIKSTGLNPDRWDNSHRGIWIHDTQKLLRVREEPETQIGWIWLFLFETYRKKVVALGEGSKWTATLRASDIAKSFGRFDTENGTLARSLYEADLFASSNGTEALASLIPQLPRAAYNVEKEAYYSALVVTMDLSKRIVQ
ncbi:MAG: hypothetical protein ACRELG_06250, partial [Gemmataceae bacterium]